MTRWSQSSPPRGCCRRSTSPRRPVADLEHRHVEGAAAEVEHEHGLVGAFLVEAVGECRRRRLVDDAEDLEPGDLAGLFGSGTLGVVEIGGDRYDSLVDRVPEERLAVTPQLLQDPREISWAL